MVPTLDHGVHGHHKLLTGQQRPDEGGIITNAKAIWVLECRAWPGPRTTAKVVFNEVKLNCHDQAAGARDSCGRKVNRMRSSTPLT